MEDLRAHGEKVFASNCAACHQATGMGVPGTFPALVGSKVVVGPKEEQINIVLNGKPGTAMAPFKHLSDADIAGALQAIELVVGHGLDPVKEDFAERARTMPYQFGGDEPRD